MTSNHYFFLSFIFVLYFLYGAASYIDKIKNSNYYYLIAICIAVMGNLSWAYFSKKMESHQQILSLGLYWDVVVGIAFLGAAFVFGNISLGPKHLLGVGLIFLGSFLLKT